MKLGNFRGFFLVACIVFVLTIVVIIFFFTHEFTYYVVKKDMIDNSRDTIVMSAATGGYTGRFPDVVQTENGLIAAYYWNSVHAPMMVGDPLGSIAMVKGNRNGDSFDEKPYFFLDEQFLIDCGLGLWTDGEKYYTEQSEAEANRATFCIEVRDPNFAKMGDKILFTFFTRLPWNTSMGGHTYLQYEGSCDYTYGRTYLMVSYDEGENWNSPVEIHCSYLDRGCAKRGNIAVLDRNTILIPLYGFNSVTGNIFTTAIVRATLEHGEWIFEDEYCTHLDSSGSMSGGAFEIGVSEVSLAKTGNDLYALCRDNGDVCISLNDGKSWNKITSLSNEGSKLHQPSLYSISKSNQILASWSEPNAGRRDIYLYLTQPDSPWNYEDKYMIYHNDYAGDMGDPTSIFLDDGKILTIYYDTNKGIVACTKTATAKFRLRRVKL